MFSSLTPTQKKIAVGVAVGAVAGVALWFFGKDAASAVAGMIGSDAETPASTEPTPADVPTQETPAASA